jgi:tRNA-specific 2-thiouridylase
VNVLVALSGGVDSSVAAARLLDEGHEVVGVTLKLWGGDSDTGCCSVADVDDARTVARRLGIEHLVFNFGDDFTRDVVDPYVAAHAAGRTPNPCIECNRHLKFDRLLRRAEVLGFDAVATGHHARIVTDPSGRPRLARGADPAKDQSYVLYVVPTDDLRRVRFPVGSMTKAEVRAEAARLGLPTAAKPDSQDVCFITATGGREAFLGTRIPLRPGRVLDTAGREVGSVDAVELVTVGQRRGLRLAGGAGRRHVLCVDTAAAVVIVGDPGELATDGVVLERCCWAEGRPPEPGTEVLAQCSAHGRPRPARVAEVGADGAVLLRWHSPQPRVAPGQSVVAYTGEVVVGGGIARAAESVTGGGRDPRPACGGPPPAAPPPGGSG